MSGLRLVSGNYKHGASLYRNRGCRCEVCRADHTARHTREQRNREQLLVLGLVDPPHGVRSTYTNYGCRCDYCKAAHSAFLKQRRSATPGPEGSAESSGPTPRGLVQ